MMADVVSLRRNWITVARDVPGIVVPDGNEAIIPQGTEVEIVHELGGDFTLRSRRGMMYRIDGAHADALGRDVPAEGSVAPPENATPLSGEALEQAVLERLKSCYDPEIPINLVDLGLIYRAELRPSAGGQHVVEIQMTLTAPGCGMGQVIVDDVKRKVESVPGVEKAQIELVFDPPWDPSMMSDAARLQAGLF